MSVELKAIFGVEGSTKSGGLFGDAGTPSLVIKYRLPGKKTYGTVDTDDPIRARKMLEEFIEKVLEEAFGGGIDVDDTEDEVEEAPKKGRRKAVEIQEDFIEEDEDDEDPAEEDEEDAEEEDAEEEDAEEEEAPKVKRRRKKKAAPEEEAKPETKRRRRKK